MSEEGGVEVRVYYLECLAQATYVVSHDGKAFIVDPRRDVESFLVVRGGWGEERERIGREKIVVETPYTGNFPSSTYLLVNAIRNTAIVVAMECIQC